MLSLETAKRLKEAGLEWEPQNYDFYVMTIFEIPLITCMSDKWTVKSVRKDVLEFGDERRVWLPRLDQILAHIEKLGYWLFLWGTANGRYCVELIKHHADGYGSKCIDFFYNESLEEAAAEALLWILREGNKHEKELQHV